MGTPCGSWDSRMRPAETPSTMDFGCEKSGCSRKSSVLVMGLFKLSYQSWFLADPAESDGQRHNDVAQAHDCRDDISQEQENLTRSEEHTSELQSRFDLVCRLLLEKKNRK